MGGNTLPLKYLFLFSHMLHYHAANLCAIFTPTNYRLLNVSIRIYISPDHIRKKDPLFKIEIETITFIIFKFYF